MSVTGLLAQIADVGRDGKRGGYSRHGFDRVERELREWFVEQAQRRELDTETDRNGNIWAWWGKRGDDAVVTGSHLDSVPGGGAFDGPLGVTSALACVDKLRADGFRPGKPIAVVLFAEEEGSRFGVPCLGSKLLSGALPATQALSLKDPDGVSLAEALTAAGVDPRRCGADHAALDGIGCFVELHVEQGRDLVDRGAAVGVATSILAHGRWHFTVAGQGNHAGTTAMAQRRDPMLPAAAAILATRRAMAAADGGRATIGRIVPVPGGTNVIPSSAEFWLDARAGEAGGVRDMVEGITSVARDAAEAEGCSLRVREESFGDPVVFDGALRDRIVGTLGAVPAIPTGAGHDAGVLAARLPTAMLFVRNPTGISHAPGEHAEPEDCERGAAALTDAIRELAR